ncbi:hypothetical protein [Myxococcus sp. RHSTA-1-4]|uniref:hypothetical protein n=1 Tax=Myxococcus sp. RHSTA-1-4 TaxID=2874601 RepID=UPI001CBD5778|nr:hypothetical protein [Myxococcus sp. RHSTA-1-4]MBZ4415255.1 hypothetical protein [Myxococcus sp. RHSTA-1-4]
MDFSTEKLMAIARKYWRADKEYEHRKERSPEALRLDALWEETLRKDDFNRWDMLTRELQLELPGFFVSSGLLGAGHCFNCVAWSGRKLGGFPPFHFAVVGCISILAPSTSSTAWSTTFPEVRSTTRS